MKTLKNLSLIIFFVFINQALGQQDEIIYSHSFHAFEVGAECADCHEGAAESENASDNLLPPMETCYNCHDEEETECSVCHTNVDEPGIAPRVTDYIQYFSHKQHITEEANCMSCHENILKDETKEYHLPSKESCNTCHEPADYVAEQNTCYSCHGKDFNFVPATHAVLWSKNHGIESNFNNKSCVHCHQVSYCQNCHQGDNLDREVHPLNYEYTHGLMAKGNKEDCMTCHQEQSFCIDCHSIKMVMPKNHSYANWSNTTNGGQHAKVALYDFDNCLSCHNDVNSDVICSVCHK